MYLSTVPITYSLSTGEPGGLLDQSQERIRLANRPVRLLPALGLWRRRLANHTK